MRAVARETSRAEEQQQESVIAFLRACGVADWLEYRYLLNVDLPDRNGQTPLALARSRGYERMADILRKARPH